MAKDENNAQGGPEGDGGKKDPNSELYEEAEPKKIIRLITVVSYLFSVSFMGIVLSAYYLFLWEPPNPRLIQRTHHLSADPQAESLIGESRLNSNHSAEIYSEYVPSNLLNDSLYPRNDEIDTQRSIRGRKMSEHFPDDISNHRKLNASFVLLRNSLIDILTGNKADVNDIRLTEDAETRKSYEKITADTKINSDPSLTVNVPLRIISGSESSKDRFTSGGSIEESSPRINHLAHNSIAPTDFTQATVESPENTVSPLVRRRKKFRRREAPDNPSKSDDTNSLRNKSTLLHTKKNQVQETDQAVPPPGWQASSPKLISIAITNGDTQIDTVTKPSLMEDDHPGELEVSSTRTEVNIPMTLAESVLFGRIYSTTTMWSDSEYTQSNSTPETIENNATEQSIVFSIE